MNIQNVSSVAQTVGRFSGDVAVPAPVSPVSVPVELPQATPVSQVATKEVVQQPSATQLQNVVDSINKTMKQSNKSMEFSVDATTKRLVVKLTDTETGQLIRQFPSEEVLAIAQSIDQYLSQHQSQQGMLLQQKA